ncbi:UNVERIFIED_CONTAM: hypothetical protein FKN15_020693 [Acipenser sinensis]
MSTGRPPLSPKLAYASEFIVQERAAPQASRSPCLGSSGDASAQSFRSRAGQVSRSAGTRPSNSNGATINSASTANLILSISVGGLESRYVPL